MRTEQEFLVDVLARLNSLGVEYMLTGSMASNYWGIPRTTHDLDFVVHLQPADVDRFVAAFANGFFIQAQSVQSVFQPPYQFNILDDLSALKADFWQLRAKAFDRQMFARRIRIRLFGIDAWTATAEDVLLHKLYWHQLTPSHRQLADCAGIYSVQQATLELDYLQHWAAELGVEADLDDILNQRVRPKDS